MVRSIAHTACFAVRCDAEKIAVSSFASFRNAAVFANGIIPDSVINSNHKIASSASSTTTPNLSHKLSSQPGPPYGSIVRGD